MGKVISKTIDKALADALEQRGLKGAPHPDTIVNFLNQKNAPKIKTLDVLSWYLLGDENNFRSFQDFKAWDRKEVMTTASDNNNITLSETVKASHLVDVPSTVASNAKTEVIKSRTIASDYIMATVLGGGLAGFLTAFITILFKEKIGYAPAIDQQTIKHTIPLILTAQFFSGLVAGWVCGKSVVSFRSEKVKSSIYQHYGWLFFISAMLFFLIRQTAVKNSFYRAGGGLLGHPDFETLGTALAGAGGLVLLSIFLKKVNYPNLKQAVQFSFIAAVFGGIGLFGGTYFFFMLLKGIGIIPVNDCNCLFSQQFFKFSFPHPERILFVIFFGFIYLLFIAYGVSLYQKYRKL